ncbi:hypothetical protein RintRC_3140 [Richelia intracellularis]|nr:hypothetical protein RintRC_3140 [Richelia intracellularis]
MLKLPNHVKQWRTSSIIAEILKTLTWQGKGEQLFTDSLALNL